MSRVLLVEDELLIAMMLEDKLRDLGHCVAGVAATVASGRQMLRDVELDVAIVEFKLADGDCDDLLLELRARRVPVVLVTAARIDPADARFANIDVLEKPVDMAKLAVVLDQLKGGVARAGETLVTRLRPRTARALIEV